MVTAGPPALQDALLECVRRKVPLLLSRGAARLVVVDSVAAPFRCEFDGASSARRARALRALGAALHGLSCTFRSPVLCINQVGARPPPSALPPRPLPPAPALTPHLPGDGGPGGGAALGARVSECVPGRGVGAGPGRCCE